MKHPIAVFYNENTTATMEDHKSPGIWKARDVVRIIEGEPECNLQTGFEKVTRKQLLMVHESGYVDGVLNLQTLNGHSNRRPAILEAILHQNGSLLAAAEYAARTGRPAFSPTSGFHHAGHAFGGGYCTFNALMIAAAQAIDEYDIPVLIIDGDAHYGDGCIDILGHWEQDPVLKNVARKIRYITTSRYKTAASFSLAILSALNYHEGLVLYQAGADCHEDDVYGSGYYSAQEMMDRDEFVFQSCKEKNLSVVWNLAGGYGSPTMRETIRLHYNTWKVARRIFC